MSVAPSPLTVEAPMQLRPIFLAAALAATLACGDDAPGGPSVAGTPYLDATIDGQAWVPDTVAGIMYGTTPDSGYLVIIAGKSEGLRQETLTFSVPFPRRGDVALGHFATAGNGVYQVIPNIDSLARPFLMYTSRDEEPGRLHVAELSRGDSVATGRFSFTAATRPDTTAHRTLLGSFRVRYTFQQIYTFTGAP